MLNLQNLGSQENVGIKYIDGLCNKFGLKLWFENDWYFCNSIKSRWFQMRSRNKAPNNHFVRLLQKQPYEDVLENRCS